MVVRLVIWTKSEMNPPPCSRVHLCTHQCVVSCSKTYRSAIDLQITPPFCHGISIQMLLRKGESRLTKEPWCEKCPCISFTARPGLNERLRDLWLLSMTVCDSGMFLSLPCTNAGTMSKATHKSLHLFTCPLCVFSAWIIKRAVKYAFFFLSRRQMGRSSIQHSELCLKLIRMQLLVL